MLWVDKYRPKKLEDLSYQKTLTLMLQKMVKSGNFPHLLFYGPSGAGKKTRVLCLLNEVFGKSAQKVKQENKIFKVNSKTVEITTQSSNYHIEMNPSDVGLYDRVVIQDIIKEIASSGVISKEHNFKVVILNEGDQLTKDAQHGLRRTMEKYMSTCRIILQCECVSKIIEPLRSRCLAIRVPAPSHEEIVEVLKYVGTQEKVNITDEFAKEIATASDRNLRRALLMFQTCAMENSQLINVKIKKTPWELYIEQIAQLIIENQSPEHLLLTRNKLYELLANCVPPQVIFEKLTTALMNRVDDSLRYDIAKWSSFHEHRMHLGSKSILHLEAFIAKFMAIYKKWTQQYDTDYSLLN